MDSDNDLIEVNPKIMMGKPVIKGTRLTVEMILQSLAAGESTENGSRLFSGEYLYLCK